MGQLGMYHRDLIGLLFLPWGVIFGPFLGAVIGELLGNKEFSQALRSGVGSLIGFLLGTFLKFVVCGYFCYQFIVGKEYNQFYKYGRRKDSIHSPQSQVADRRNAYPLFYIPASCQSVPARIKVS